MARKVPPVNATVTKVQAPGTGEDYDGPSAPGDVLWQGTADAHVTERVLVTSGREGVDHNVVTSLVVPASLPVASGYQVTFVRDGDTFTRQVRDLEPRPDYGFTRLYFQDA